MRLVLQIVGIVFALLLLRLAYKFFEKGKDAKAWSIAVIGAVVLFCSMFYGFFETHVIGKIFEYNKKLDSFQKVVTEMQAELSTHQQEIDKHQKELRAVQGTIRTNQTEVLASQTDITNQYHQLKSIQVQLLSPAFMTNLSYFVATQSTNQQQQLSQFRIALDGFTNSLADAALMPTFDLYINETKITNGTMLSLKSSRMLNLKVQNTSPITAEQLKVMFQAPYGLEPTNLLSARKWIQIPDDKMKSDEPTNPDYLSCYGWRWNADTIIEGNGPCYVDSLEISTNFTYPVIKSVFENSIY
jgi:uncharacterized coiled-coil protein SlyX